MAHRLDHEAALMLVSAVDVVAPGSASEESPASQGEKVATVEHMHKLSKGEVRSLTASLVVEWQAVPTMSESTGSGLSPMAVTAEQYWTPERAAKLRRLQYEPMSPGPAIARARGA